MAWHLITSEYPPQHGGVSDYTHMVASHLASAREEVHVWCPPAEDETPLAPGVSVHREMGRFAPADLRRAGHMLNRHCGPRRLLVQWVPHGYGYRAMNLPFCLWLWTRATRHRDRVEIVVHEPYLTFQQGSWKQRSVAVAHRLMTMVLLRAAHRIWMSIPAWEAHWRPYALGRSLEFNWLPVMSNIAVVDDPLSVKAARARIAPAGGLVVGHFGTYDRNTADLLMESVPAILGGGMGLTVLLMGRGSESMRAALIGRTPELAGHVHATGVRTASDLSVHLSACDVMVQPYIDGVSSRRTGIMAGLAHGVPVITTSGRLTEPLWAESGAVALAPAGDMAGLLKETERLLSNADARRRLGAAGRALYDERFDVKRTIAALREAAA